ncbi:MAG TPA: hypothetical protein VN844_02990 [Pyrinomonadaceae bacterium]|nr:hypothetical protein [Pyrinomonadaceae bacterium]
MKRAALGPEDRGEGLIGFGIDEDCHHQARSAVNTVSGFLKEKLPAPIAGQVDNVLSGAGGMTDKLGDAAAKVGGLFGGS